MYGFLAFRQNIAAHYLVAPKLPGGARKFTIAGIKKRTVINLTACKAATAAPTPNSSPTRLIPIVPPGAAPSKATTLSTPRNRLIKSPTKTPLIRSVKVIIKAGFQSNCNSVNVSLFSPVPITVPIAIPRTVLVPKGQSATSSWPLMLNKPAPKIAPKRGAAGIPVRSIREPKDAPARRYKSKVTKEGI